MRDYSQGLDAREPAHAEYLEWLVDNPHGLVLGVRAGRTGALPLHRPHCETLSYDLVRKGQQRRTGKICFEDSSELRAWLAAQSRSADDLKRCSSCHD